MSATFVSFRPRPRPTCPRPAQVKSVTKLPHEETVVSGGAQAGLSLHDEVIGTLAT